MSQTTDCASVDILSPVHRNCLEHALMRILHTAVAEEAYAEILYGLPTKKSWMDFNQSWQGHPSLDHAEPCAGALDRAREFRSGFDLTTLEFPTFTLLAFDSAEPGSKSFHLRLLELLAVSCHQIAVYLSEALGHNDHHGEHDLWRDEAREVQWWNGYRPQIAFSYGPYIAADQYPDGTADVVGYWAEARIFGGIMVFDRGESENECREVYIHACGRFSPLTIWPPTPEQYDALIRFLMAEVSSPDERNGTMTSLEDTQTPSCPLPIIPTHENAWRWHPWDAFKRFHIFRDRYERKVADTKPPPPCQQPIVDWPELGDHTLLVTLEGEKAAGVSVDEADIAYLWERVKMITPSSPLWNIHGPKPDDTPIEE